ncbi:MAG: ParA family protein [Kibdelosporangium sp.]
MAKVHPIFSQKGGVGKTTIAVNLAAVVATTIQSDPADPSVLVVSIDPQGSAVWWAERTDVEKLPFDFEQMDDNLDGVSKLSQEPYEHVFVDAPGSLARPRILATVLDQADDVLVPAVPEPLAYMPTLRTVRDFIEPRHKPYLVVRNLWDPRDGKTDLDALTSWLGENDLQTANTVVRRYKMHTTAAGEGRVVTQYPRGRTATEAKNDLLQLALECGYGGTRKAV